MGSRPWMALLEYNTTQPFRARFKCGGTLITSKFVLTAAHCIKDTLVSVRLGEYDLNKTDDCVFFGNEKICLDSPLDVPIEKMFVHGGFNKTRLVNDIALIRLKDPVRFTDWIRPICLPMSLDLQLESQSTTKPLEVVGWGITELNQLSNVPKKAFIRRLPLTQCIFDIRDKRFCATADEVDSCQGDSGGPLAFHALYNGKQRLVQLGIVSYGYEKCREHPYAFYTDVAEYMGWITETIAKQENGP
nr:serine protease grass-like [Drosophila bipectinata]